MKTLLSVTALGLMLGASAFAADEFQLQCKSSYDVNNAEDSMTVKGPTLLAPYVADTNGGSQAGGTKNGTHWGVGYSAAYSSRTAKVTISVTNAQGVNVSSIGMISTEQESELQMQLDAQTRIHVVCTIIKK